MAGVEKWDLQNDNCCGDDYNSYTKKSSTGFPKTSLPGVVPQNAPVEYKLYVRPIPLNYDETSLEDIFSVCGNVTEIYIAPISNEGFRWAFIYYADQASADEAIRMFNDSADYGFKVKYANTDANKKKFPKPNAGNASMMNYSYTMPGKLILPEVKTNTQINGVSYVTPPNCRFCRKLTIFSCSSCHNPFCNTECSLDGWRFHTSECIKVANLIYTDETKKAPVVQPNGTNPNLSDTVVSFMKNISISKKDFRPDEFAAVCKPGGKANESVENDRVFKPFPKSSEHNFQPFMKSSEHSLEPFPKSSEHSLEPFPKSSERNHYTDDTDSFQFKKPSFSQNHSQVLRNDLNHSLLPKTKYESGSETDERSVQNGHHRDSDNHIEFRKKKVTDRKTADKSVPRNAPAKRRSGSDTERIRSSQAGGRLQRDNPKENVPAEQEERIRNSRARPRLQRDNPKENSPAEQEKTIQPLSDLNLQINQVTDTLVTSVVDDKTFFVADPVKSTEFMAKFNEIAGELERLENVRIGTLCLSAFEDGWYRAKVLSIDPLKVLYIDFGNEEIVDRDSLKYLPQKYIRTSPLACKVQLSNGNVEENKIGEFGPAVVYPVKYDNESGIWIVDIL